jgi:hypothetical protein
VMNAILGFGGEPFGANVVLRVTRPPP